jgi:hypothetical protein
MIKELQPDQKLRHMTAEDIAAIPGFDLMQKRIAETVKQLQHDFEQKIQQTADDRLTVLGHKFVTEKQQLKFWQKRVTDAVDTNTGIHYLYLDIHTSKVLLCRFDPKTLQVE